MKSLWAFALAAALTACISQSRTTEPALYDLGIAPQSTLRPVAADVPTSAIRVHVSARSWLNDTSMHYRLVYSDDMRTRTYAYARWLAPPAELIGQRLRQRLSQGGAVVNGPGHDIEIELEEFTQIFESATNSTGRVSVQVRILGSSVSTATFSEEANAPTPDAAGGVRALSQATDTLITRIAQFASSY